MSMKRRLDRLDAALVGGSEVLKITAQYAGMTDKELLVEADRLARDLHSNPARLFDTSGPPSPLFTHLSDEQLIAEAEEGRTAERNARLKMQA